ncbi:MAG: hypothetical protein Q9208_001930 [Pyrenodesmia sp. 3 TL-2023]
MKCNASKNSEGNSKKSLSCDDECARLERNRKLALALNIDPEAHKDDHIPYSSDTLKMFRESVKWSQEQEREFRVFAADEAEKRLRFKPMPSHQRAFLHALAQDFGLDSESMDPEPHRHVAVFKTPRFVMAPMKTLQECVRIRLNAEAAAASLLEDQRRLRSNNEAFNGFLLKHPRFGLTIEELRSELSPQFQSTPGLAFDISFLPSEEIVIKAKPATPSTNVSASSVEAALKAMKPSVLATISTKRLAETCQMCSSDASLNIVRRGFEDEGAIDGWSRVAAKAAAPRSVTPQRGVGEKSVYTVLGSKLKDAKRKKEELEKAKAEEFLADDWEEEARREEMEAFGTGKNIADTVEEEAARSELLGSESYFLCLFGPYNPIVISAFAFSIRVVLNTRNSTTAMSQPNHIEKVAIIGATGHIGKCFAEELLKTGKHTVTALIRPDTNLSSLPAGIQQSSPVNFADPNQESLTAALAGQHFLIITLSLAAPPDLHSAIVRAAVRAGVRWIMPNVYGPDVFDQALQRDVEVFAKAVRQCEEIERLGASYVACVCGFWYEWSLAIGEPWFGFDAEARRVTVFDEGEVKVGVSTWGQCGRAVARLLSLPIEMEEKEGVCLERWRNKGFYFRSFRVSQRDMLESLKRVTGTGEGDWEVRRQGTVERRREGEEELARGEMTGFAKMMYSRVFFKSGEGDFEGRKGVSNGVLGLPEESLDEATKRAVQMVESGWSPSG